MSVEERTKRLTAALTQHGVPENLHHGLALWLTHGIRPGSFLCAVLRNDLRESFAQADLSSRFAMFDLVCALHSDMPGGAWGSADAMAHWTKTGGLVGLYEAADG